MILDRREALQAALGAVVGGFVVAGPARAAAPVALAAVKVDCAPIAARGLPNYAVRVARLAAPAAEDALAGRITPRAAGAATLVLRLSLVQLTSDPAGSRDRVFGRDQPMDWIEGDAVLIDARGRTIASRHIVTTGAPRMVERISTPVGEDRRIANLAALFARWAISELKL